MVGGLLIMESRYHLGWCAILVVGKLAFCLVYIHIEGSTSITWDLGLAIKTSHANLTSHRLSGLVVLSSNQHNGSATTLQQSAANCEPGIANQIHTISSEQYSLQEGHQKVTLNISKFTQPSSPTKIPYFFSPWSPSSIRELRERDTLQCVIVVATLYYEAGVTEHNTL